MNRKVLMLVIALGFLIFFGGVIILRTSVNESLTKENVFSGNGVKVTIDKLVFKQNEEIVLRIDPPTGYLAVLKYGNAANFGTMGTPDGKQTLRTYSYGPGLADIGIWKQEANSETVNFYSQNEKGEWVANEPAVKFQVRITK